MNRDERMIEDMMSTCRYDCGIDLSNDDYDSVCPTGPNAHHRQLITGADVVWAICSRCKGDGTLKGYPGVYTQDDFDSGDTDFEDYIEHRRECEDCDGLGKVRQLTQAAEERPEVFTYLQDAYDLWAIEAAERRAGA